MGIGEQKTGGTWTVNCSCTIKYPKFLSQGPAFGHCTHNINNKKPQFILYGYPFTCIEL